MPVRKRSRGSSQPGVTATSRRTNYWCHAQAGGHPTLYFCGHRLISRAEYRDAVGPDDCDPHVSTGREPKRKRGPRTTREQFKRM